MPVRSRKNQYLGINAHLHSILQNEPGGWSVFHSAHIIHIAEAIDKMLPPGYIVAPERSLQIREFSTNGDSIDGSEDYLTSAVIHEINANETIGREVTRIELLSPENKPSAIGFEEYKYRRLSALRKGGNIVEIDFLHQSKPVIKYIPSYPDHEPGAHPYTINADIATSEELLVYGFGVDTPVPSVTIPLSDNQAITLDFGQVYNQSFERFGIYGYQVDYEQEPPRFDTYRADDQQRIRARMQAVLRAHEQGKDLEQGPFEIES